MYALVVRQTNDISTDINPVELLPRTMRSRIIDLQNSCSVDGLFARLLVLYTNEGARFELVYPEPFSQSLLEFLTTNFDVAAFEFVGERLKYGRLKRLLDTQ